VSENKVKAGYTGLEVRSIDYVPKSERHGKVWHIGPLWFMGNAQIATLAIGVVSFATGGNLIWSAIAIIIGLFIGTTFMAAHSSQGPKLGLPQMIQSRPQFGYVGCSPSCNTPASISSTRFSLATRSPGRSTWARAQIRSGSGPSPSSPR